MRLIISHPHEKFDIREVKEVLEGFKEEIGEIFKFWKESYPQLEMLIEDC